MKVVWRMMLVSSESSLLYILMVGAVGVSEARRRIQALDMQRSVQHVVFSLSTLDRGHAHHQRFTTKFILVKYQNTYHDNHDIIGKRITLTSPVSRFLSSDFRDKNPAGIWVFGCVKLH